MNDTSATLSEADLKDRAAALVEAAKKAGADAADAVVVSGQSLGVDVRNGKVEETDRSENNAFSLRVFVGKRLASVSSNNGKDVDALAARAVAMAKVAPEDEFASLADSTKLARDFPDLELFDERATTAEAMADRARECEDAALSVSGVSKSNGASAGWGSAGLVLVTSDGFEGAYRSSSFSNSVSVVAGEGTGMERDYEYDVRRFHDDLKSPAEIGASAGERAVKRLNPRKVKTQKLAVLLDPRVSGGIVGHLAGAVNGSSIARKTSFLRDDMGKQVMAKGVTISDDPHRKRGLSSRPFDGEGVAAEAMNMVEDGVLNHWYLDTATGRELGLETNGRASRGGANPSPGRTNLTLHPGEKSPEELMKEMGTGLYINEFIGSGVSLVTGDYSRGASGFWIENGEISFPVSEVTIAGNLREMFATMEPASDLEYRFSTNAPSILIASMALAGL